MLSALCCALLGLAQAGPLPAAEPSRSLRPAMLDAPREALQTGETLLSRGGLDAAQRETLLRDMATAALLLSAGDAARVADSLDALGRDSGRVSASAMADIVRARIRLDGEQIESGLALAGSATAALRTIGDPYWDAVAD